MMGCRYRYVDGNVFDGEWRRNQQWGRGTMRFADGDVYQAPPRGRACRGRAELLGWRMMPCLPW
jgi:hypothetical protein